MRREDPRLREMPPPSGVPEGGGASPVGHREVAEAQSCLLSLCAQAQGTAEGLAACGRSLTKKNKKKKRDRERLNRRRDSEKKKIKLLYYYNNIIIILL